MRFAISLPQFYADGAFDPDAFLAYVTRAEALGFDSAWTQEQLLGSMPHLGPTETMTYAAACTRRIRLGCSVYVTTQHNPVHLAKSLSSLDQLSRGRLDVGVGFGNRRYLSAFGIEPDGLVTRFTEGLRLMKALWSEERVDFDGRFWQVEGAGMEPKAFQKPHPPLWFGGSSSAALRRAVRLGDGFFGAGSTTTARFAEQMKTVRAELAEQERDASGFGVAKRVYVVVDNDASRAKERAEAGLSGIYGSAPIPDLFSVPVYGPPEECVAGLRAVGEAGAELVLLTTVDDHADQMERLAAEVLPHLS